MWRDPIVEETRNLRNEYANKFNHDLDKIYQDIVKRQSESNNKRASLPPRKPNSKAA